MSEYLDWLRGYVDGIDDVRDLFYIVLGIPALLLLWWRSVSANRQARAALDQAKIAQEQVVLAQSQLMIHRFQMASEMLSSELLATRIGGIYALMRLAENRPEEFHIQTMELFCAFLRNPPPYPVPHEGVHDDIHTILQLLKRRSESSLQLEKEQRFHLNLQKAQLTGTALRGSKFANADFDGADLSDVYAEMSDFSHASLRHCKLREGRFGPAKFFLATLFYSDLSRSNFQAADFRRANFHFVNLTDSSLKYADLTGAHISATNLTGASLCLADLSGARIKSGRKLQPDGTIDSNENFCTLTQAQIDEAAADPNRPPIIDSGTVDANTGQPIMWSERHGKRNWERLQALKQNRE